MLLMLFFQMRNIVFGFLQSGNDFCFDFYICQKVRMSYFRFLRTKKRKYCFRFSSANHGGLQKAYHK